jgi:hypothetical protein
VPVSVLHSLQCSCGIGVNETARCRASCRNVGWEAAPYACLSAEGVFTFYYCRNNNVSSACFKAVLLIKYVYIIIS